MWKDFLQGMHSEEWGKTIIVLWKDNLILPDIAKFLTGMHPEDWRLKILVNHDETLNKSEQPDLSKFLSWINTEWWGIPAKKIKNKVSDILD